MIALSSPSEAVPLACKILCSVSTCRGMSCRYKAIAKDPMNAYAAFHRSIALSLAHRCILLDARQGLTKEDTALLPGVGQHARHTSGASAQVSAGQSSA